MACKNYINTHYCRLHLYHIPDISLQIILTDRGRVLTTHSTGFMLYNYAVTSGRSDLDNSECSTERTITKIWLAVNDSLKSIRNAIWVESTEITG